MQMEYSGHHHWTVVFETWNLYGESEALEVALKVMETDQRSYILLNLANRLVRAGEPEKARVFFASFEETYAPSTDSRPSLRRGNRRSAAIAASALGQPETALKFANEYAGGINFAGAAYNSRDAARLYVDINEEDLALEAIGRIIENAPEPGETVHTFFFGSWSTTDRRNEYLGAAMGFLCKLGRYDEAFQLGAGDAARGDMATSDCYAALHDADAPMSIEALTEALGLRSPKRLERMRAAEYVEEGNYNAAATLIRQSLSSVPASDYLTMSQSNVPYLRLAIAMRDEALVNEVAATIIDNSVDVIGLDATRLYSKVGALLHKWPELNER
jgi:tetratricopeptide (TPR) repeat protein